MTRYTLIWQQSAMKSLLAIKSSDPDLARSVRDAVDDFARDPAPVTSMRLGEGGLRRLRTGRARTLYLVHDDNSAVEILTLGISPAD